MQKSANFAIVCIILLIGLNCQSSQVDLLAKSEMLDSVAVVFHAEGVTPLGGCGGMLPQKTLKN